MWWFVDFSQWRSFVWSFPIFSFPTYWNEISGIDAQHPSQQHCTWNLSLNYSIWNFYLFQDHAYSKFQILYDKNNVCCLFMKIQSRSSYQYGGLGRASTWCSQRHILLWKDNIHCNMCLIWNYHLQCRPAVHEKELQYWRSRHLRNCDIEAQTFAVRIHGPHGYQSLPVILPSGSFLVYCMQVP